MSVSNRDGGKERVRDPDILIVGGVEPSSEQRADQLDKQNTRSQHGAIYQETSWSYTRPLAQLLMVLISLTVLL